MQEGIHFFEQSLKKVEAVQKLTEETEAKRKAEEEKEKEKSAKKPLSVRRVNLIRDVDPSYMLRTERERERETFGQLNAIITYPCLAYTRSLSQVLPPETANGKRRQSLTRTQCRPMCLISRLTQPTQKLQST